MHFKLFSKQEAIKNNFDQSRFNLYQCEVKWGIFIFNLYLLQGYHYKKNK